MATAGVVVWGIILAPAIWTVFTQFANAGDSIKVLWFQWILHREWKGKSGQLD